MSDVALRQLSRTPRLYVADAFASDDEIAHMLAVASDRDDLSRRGVSMKHDTTGFSFEMPVPGDPCLEAYVARLHATVGMTNDFGQTLRFRRYAVGESHPPHLDCYRIDDRYLVATALLYLNDTAAGGETTFPRAVPKPVAVRPRKGRLVVWFNHYPNGLEDPSAWHESTPVTQGEKATLTEFIYKPIEYAAVRVPAGLAKAEGE
ncbi:MAG: 2OG-Fe(II) oxygenase [Acidobacteriota bacterium]|nr:2OG-Fe(II) oxygenase [Acidobacteriota bacterium]